MSEPEWKQSVPHSTALGSVPLNNEALQQDWKACDGYIAYSAELLRISLLAISGLAALCLKVHEKGTNSPGLPISVFKNSFIALLTAAGLSILHRYVAIDSMTFHIEALRRRKRDRPEFTIKGRAIGGKSKKIESDVDRAERQEWLREWFFRAAYWILLAAAASLIVGVGMAVSAMQGVQLIPAGR